MNTQTQPPAAEFDAHSCSYYCKRPACVLRQRDELVRVYVQGWKEKEPAKVDGAGFNGMTDAETSATASVFGLTQPTTPPAVEGDPLPGVEVPCNMHPDAPHGFDRNASHNADRYVCDCEGWEPEAALTASRKGG